MRRGIAIGALVCCGASAEGSTIRHDVPDASYTSLAATFPAVGKVGGASGTLVGPRHVLTAAHVGASSVTFGGTTYTVDTSTPHPNWTGSLENGYDLRVLELTADVVGITPMTIHYGGGELGNVGTFVGFGKTGTGLTGATLAAGTKRAGTNLIDFSGTDFVDDEGLPLSESIIATDFDEPAGDATALEFNVAGGDSGGGLFVNFGSGFRLVGVGSFLAAEDGTNNADYGDYSGFARTSSGAAWLQSILPTPVPSPSAATGGVLIGLLATRRRRG